MPDAKATILVCDDETPIRSIVASKLRKHGFDVVEARNGLEGLCTCDPSATPSGARPPLNPPIVPSIVVTDLQMPMMNGIEMALRLRLFAPTAQVPIIMLTARGYIIEQARLSETNIVAMMQKPFSASELLTKVQGVLNEKHGHGFSSMAA